MFRRCMSPGRSCSSLLALTFSVFSLGQAEEEETTSKEREQGTQSQRWAWEWTVFSSALWQPVRRRWSQGESTWWVTAFPGLSKRCCYCRNSIWEAPLANALWNWGELHGASHRRLANSQKHIYSSRSETRTFTSRTFSALSVLGDPRMATHIHILTWRKGCLRTKPVALTKERKKNCFPLLVSTSASGEDGVHQGHAVA